MAKRTRIEKPLYNTLKSLEWNAAQAIEKMGEINAKLVYITATESFVALEFLQTSVISWLIVITKEVINIYKSEEPSYE